MSTVYDPRIRCSGRPIPLGLILLATLAAYLVAAAVIWALFIY